MTRCFVPDLQGLGIQFDALDEELIVMKPKGQVHFGDSLVLSAEQQPELITRDVGRDFESLA